MEIVIPIIILFTTVTLIMMKIVRDNTKKNIENKSNFLLKEFDNISNSIKEFINEKN